jgi:hypothetical protein
MEKLVLLKDDPNSIKLAKIADLLGVQHAIVRDIPERPSCMILTGRIFDVMNLGSDESPHCILVYDIESSQPLSRELKPFLHRSASLRIGNARPDITSVFSGLTIQSTADQTVFSHSSDFSKIFLADDHPFFLSRGRLFLLASNEVLDIDGIAENGCEPGRKHFADLIPFVMFIKWALKERCWHLPEHCASIIVDDPLLRPRYGFIDFAAFLSWVQKNNLGATFAFIPWNHNRSDPDISSMFRMHPERLSICVHGCDHTAGEFSTSATERLDAIVKTATARMMKHQNTHTLPFDKVMVFPQGKFSKESLQILMRNGYVGAVNTSVFSTNYDGELTVRNLLEMAVTYPSGVPLYRRRQPVDIFDFACDLFFEKPIFIVQHHQDFKGGFSPLLSFIRKIQEIRSDIKWMPVGAVLARSHWERIQNNGDVEVRVPTPLTHIGDSNTEMGYSLKQLASIALRRHLSEFRDNHIHKSRLLSSVVTAIRG